MSYSHALANCCGGCWNALVSPPSSGNRASFCRAMRDGYLSWSASNPGAQAFRRSLGSARWGDLDAAARLFSNRVHISDTRDLYLGTRDFLGFGWRHGDLDNRLSDECLTGNPLVPSPSQGFTDPDYVKGGALTAIASWRTSALGIVNHRDFNRLDQGGLLAGLAPGTTWRDYYTNHVRSAATLYVAALGSPNNLMSNVRQPYYSYLHQNPARIWRAYLAALYPAMRQMAERMTFSVLAGFDPYRDRPPSSAPSALVGGALQGLTFGTWNP